VAAFDVARRWDLTVLALVIIGAVQVALLVSPPGPRVIRCAG
jgi:hypothetical protein